MSRLQLVFLSALCSSLLLNFAFSKPQDKTLIRTKNATAALNSTFNNSSIQRETILQTTPIQNHIGREHIIESSKAVINQSTDIKSSSDIVKPVRENPIEDNMEVAQIHDHEKPSVPKKGVSFPEPVNTAVVHKPKPLITETDTDYIDHVNGDKISSNNKSVNQIDQVLLKKNIRSNYIVPIVAVILSVPLVAILLSFIYKRSSDWWQHRNYKRMDFLIEGMYQN
ncbi:hypothetical protein ABEB36_004502 [Hypothenemus hampei]|uniref:Uncharacterized protein n=1 Tax=Hypothenemus hampei TaxID=57062 RepID=A0ABD1F3J4_HYPHA